MGHAIIYHAMSKKTRNILIVVPYGNLDPAQRRDEQLAQLLACLSAHAESLPPKTYMFVLIAEQVSPAKYFNRGQLINIGVQHFTKTIGAPWNIIMHDVDMLPDNNLFAEYLKASPAYSMMPLDTDEYRRAYGDFRLEAGAGIFMTDLKTFTKANGFPNDYWGWGGEDNALGARYRRMKVRLARNQNIGQITSIDTQRTSNADKMASIKRERVRNMTVYERMATDKSNWKSNGYAQLVSMDFRVMEEMLKELHHHAVLHIKIELDERGLDETIAQNESVYARLATR